VQHKCICHSLALCIQYAVFKLPSNIGFLLSEIPNWFCHSELRREAYKELFRVINPASESEPVRTGPLPFEKPSFTRWLVRGKVMFNILVNWEELMAYFTSAELAQYNTKFKAILLKKMLSDYKNDLFFEFATPIGQEFERLNSLFQQTKLILMNRTNKYSYIRRVFRTDCVMPKTGKKKIHQVGFGVSFINSI
jgi:hypothetical protein